MSVEFQDNRARVIGVLNDAVTAYLYEAGGELTSQVKRNTRVDTGQLKGSWGYAVDEENGECVVGSTLQNAIWEEFGTGEFADGNKGRKDTPWTYRDEKGNFHKTSGKKPSRAFQKAFDSTKNKIVKQAQTVLSEAMNNDS